MRLWSLSECQLFLQFLDERNSELSKQLYNKKSQVVVAATAISVTHDDGNRRKNSTGSSGCGNSSSSLGMGLCGFEL